MLLLGLRLIQMLPFILVLLKPSNVAFVPHSNGGYGNQNINRFVSIDGKRKFVIFIEGRHVCKDGVFDDWFSEMSDELERWK